MSTDSVGRPRRRAGLITGALMTALASGLAVGPAQAGAALYVDKDSVGGPCSDVRPAFDVSAARPWCSLTRAVAAAPSGAAVTVRRGVYPALTVTGNRLRTQTVSFAAAPGEAVTIRRIVLTNSSRLAFSGMTVPDGAEAGTNSTDITFARNTISDGVNIRAGADNVTVEDNVIRNDGGNAVNFSSTRTLDPISDVVIRGNRITRAVADGIQLKNFRNVLVERNEISGVARVDPAQHSDVVQTVFGGSGLILRGNYVHDNAGGILVKDGATSGVVLENNLIVDNDGNGMSYAIQIWQSSAPRLVNNTVWNNRYGVLLRSGTTGGSVRNNVLQTFGVLDGATLTYENHNLIGSGSGTGSRDLAGDPAFRNAALGDYELAAGSRAIDAGTSAGAPATDRLGRPRVDDPGVADTGAGTPGFFDLGALERQTGSGTPGPAPAPAPEPAPAPPPPHTIQFPRVSLW